MHHLTRAVVCPILSSMEFSRETFMENMQYSPLHSCCTFRDIMVSDGDKDGGSCFGSLL